MGTQGTMVCVGVGMMLGAHLTPRARAEIEHADIVFALVSDPLVELWLQELRPDLRSLQPYYGDGSSGGKPRRESYREMVDAMLAEVRAGRRVCGAFYGHPGVFALVPHKAIGEARDAGFSAHMEPGISAEDCLYADLGIDPGDVGCQHFEASQFLCHQRRADPSAYLVLWQVGVVGDRSTRRFATGPAYRRLLVDVLAAAGYPPDHEVIAYEAATLPIGVPRMDRLLLSAVEQYEFRIQTTLVLPPALALVRNERMLEKISRLDEVESSVATTALDPECPTAGRQQVEPVPA